MLAAMRVSAYFSTGIESLNDLTMRDNAAMQTMHNRAIVGRNDQCPCGSGKKYKRCCLTIQNVAQQESPWQKQRIASDSLTDDMIEFGRKQFGEEIFEAWLDFNQSPLAPPLDEDLSERQIFFP